MGKKENGVTEKRENRRIFGRGMNINGNWVPYFYYDIIEWNEMMREDGAKGKESV